MSKVAPSALVLVVVFGGIYTLLTLPLTPDLNHFDTMAKERGIKHIYLGYKLDDYECLIYVVWGAGKERCVLD